MPAAVTSSRRILVPPERLTGWLTGFGQRHGEPAVQVEAGGLTLRSPDGAVAEIELIWGPLLSADPLTELCAAMVRRRRFGALLVRRSAHAVGIIDGSTVQVSSVDTHYVQGRTKAGGWSQLRYARRRGHQADRALASAADDAARVLLPVVAGLDGLALGGDRVAVQIVLGTPGLEPLGELAGQFGGRVLPTPDPRRRVLDQFALDYLACPIALNGAAQDLRR